MNEKANQQYFRQWMQRERSCCRKQVELNSIENQLKFFIQRIAKRCQHPELNKSFQEIHNVYLNVKQKVLEFAYESISLQSVIFQLQKQSKEYFQDQILNKALQLIREYTGNTFFRLNDQQDLELLNKYSDYIFNCVPIPLIFNTQPKPLEREYRSKSVEIVQDKLIQQQIEKEVVQQNSGIFVAEVSRDLFTNAQQKVVTDKSERFMKQQLIVACVPSLQLYENQLRHRRIQSREDYDKSSGSIESTQIKTISPLSTMQRTTESTQRSLSNSKISLSDIDINSEKSDLGITISQVCTSQNEEQKKKKQTRYQKHKKMKEQNILEERIQMILLATILVILIAYAFNFISL